MNQDWSSEKYWDDYLRNWQPAGDWDDPRYYVGSAYSDANVFEIVNERKHPRRENKSFLPYFARVFGDVSKEVAKVEKRDPARKTEWLVIRSNELFGATLGCMGFFDNMLERILQAEMRALAIDDKVTVVPYHAGGSSSSRMFESRDWIEKRIGKPVILHYLHDAPIGCDHGFVGYHLNREQLTK